MMYLIAQLAGWLLLTAAFAALAGWAYAAQRAAGAEAQARRAREGLVDSLAALAADGAPASDDPAAEREVDSLRRMADINAGRVAELERLLAGARASADEHASHAAELERELELRAAEAAGRPAAPEGVVDAEVSPVEDPREEEIALQGWRLRYFEQRVRYLESLDAAPPSQQPPPEPPAAEWRARVAEARAAHAEDELRALAAPVSVQIEDADAEGPFAANADVDTLLRWRMLYLERRVAHLQAEAEAAPAPGPAPMLEAAPDPDRWKWRARYLEARVRHFEGRLAQRPLAPLAAPVAHDEEDEAPAPAPIAHVPSEKPPVLPAPRHGAPDDFTLIEGVSLQQQSTLYSIGVFHFDQIAAWRPAHVAWVDRYLRLRGRIEEEEWIAQAIDLAREGPAAARRALAEAEDA